MFKLLEFFAEENGMLSNMRLMSFAKCMTALFNVVYCTLHGTVCDIWLVLSLLGVAFTGKIIQKGIEENGNITKQ